VNRSRSRAVRCFHIIPLQALGLVSQLRGFPFAYLIYDLIRPTRHDLNRTFRPLLESQPLPRKGETGHHSGVQHHREPPQVVQGLNPSPATTAWPHTKYFGGPTYTTAWPPATAQALPSLGEGPFHPRVEHVPRDESFFLRSHPGSFRH
jgi:hypothetical protein